MVRYTVDELFHLKPTESLPVQFDAEEFKAIIEKVKQIQALKEEEFNAHGGHFNRRRSSHHHHGRPKVKHTKPKVTTDSDGWSTFEAANKKVNEDEESENVSVAVVPETLKVKPNNKNISSSRPADNKDIIADKQTHSFNAFAALESDEEEET
ncbi:hypothetical protein Kpol_413p6 [Vanderwaltozyma polyspora DSM 70294]|uniref:Cap-associated protein CAF20 n=1 Tax=Vanderwaltozyma polyspora (strain ATCC 22028 / DSM 70294 / BCRC 21397 / CBS 2163 / NBRC 10782 / NRRL Y-8283 / UCD 57-17) TaxID=436907 RepID=CAF20_VANPO|nr:uncharacterized protein Kpol_413p6 [Vanderwaltozyma polyspora DSM 70294]A7TRH1.1 RecName: Full=Cap-associated protein CAF20 [Vanderwaltozyma polyspora DSM 70294]EDO15131.1 hypothetical protein Kpol_413p6 [Vanderwaltozyma polyspora DSM 70294]